MNAQREEIEVAESAPASKPRITIVVGLAMLLGMLLSVMAAGAFVHYQTSTALEDRLVAAEQQLKEKSIALDEMTAQIKALSRQIQILKEHSIARSGSADERVKRR